MSNKFIPRLYVHDSIYPDTGISLSASTAHYLRTVMRLHINSTVFLFNETDGEYTAKIKALGKSQVDFTVGHCVREPYMGADITVLCSVIAKENFRFIIEKGTELGARKFQPIITAHTNAPKVRLDKVREYALQSTQQCERLDIPYIGNEEKISTVMHRWDTDIPILYACERGGDCVPDIADKIQNRPFAILTGPEGGFSDDEHAWFVNQPHIHPVSLGPRIMRAETAAIAVLSAVQCMVGDWTDGIPNIG